jgi:hypothetical protein
VGTPVCKFYDFEIEQVIAEYLLMPGVALRTPADVAREIVKIARFAVPQVRKEKAWMDLSTAIGIALEKIPRKKARQGPSRWLKKHLAAFEKFAAIDGRMEKAQSLCFDCQIDEAEDVIEVFLVANGLPEMDWFDLRVQAFTLVRFLEERRGHVSVRRCPECCSKARLARRVVRASQRGGVRATLRLMMEINYCYGVDVGCEVWAEIVDMHADQEHPYFRR